MDLSYLVDVNLPEYFNFFNDGYFIFESEINLKMSDPEIGHYALKNDLLIHTKDTDFYNPLIVVTIALKIIYFQLGNCSLKQLYLYFTENWAKIQAEVENSKLIIVKENHVECIS